MLPELFPTLPGADSEALSLSRVVWGPSFSSTFAPRRRCREWLLSVTASVAQARAHPGRNGEGWLALALLSVHSFPLPPKPEPRNVP